MCARYALGLIIAIGPASWGRSDDARPRPPSADADSAVGGRPSWFLPGVRNPSSRLNRSVPNDGHGQGERLHGNGELEPYWDWNLYEHFQLPSDPTAARGGSDGMWIVEWFPEGLIYRPYLASPKASRLATTFVHVDGDGWLWDAWLGTQVGVVRWGTGDADWPAGFQIDIEGSAQTRLDPSQDMDLRSTDFRAGIPFTFGFGPHRTKIAYYHLSSHLGDEFLIRNPGYPRLNYARDVLVLGHSIFVTPKARLYAEAGWAFDVDVAREWEFQFGFDYAPAGQTTPLGEPFFAANAHLREEVDFSGGLTVQAGWAWRGRSGRQVRTGIQYFNGLSPQGSFPDRFEEQIGFGLWYDP